MSRRALILTIMLVLAALGALGLRGVVFNSDVSIMLPNDAEIVRNVRFFQESELFGKVVISLGVKEGSQDARDRLFRAADSLADELRSPMLPDVTSGITDENLEAEMADLLRASPEVFTEEDLREIDDLLSPEDIGAKLKAAYLQILKPGGIFLNDIFNSDPLGLNLMVYRKVQKLSGSMGYKAELVDGHLLSEDGLHTLVIVRPSVEVTDTVGARKLIARIDEALAGLPDGIEADVVGGHYHTASNETVIKRDIGLTLSIAAVAFVLLFIFVVGDARAIIIYLIPAFSVLLSVSLTYLIVGPLSYAVMGLSAVVAGIAIDYGIHIYVALKRGSDGPVSPVRAVARPVVVGALTTIGIFIAFFFSSIEGYHQMAVFSMVSIIISLVCALLVLPAIVPSGGKGFGKSMASLESLAPGGMAVVVAWLAITLALAFFATDVRFQTSMKNIDGTQAHILESEERLNSTWGGERIAMLVADSDDITQAFTTGEKLFGVAAGVLGRDNVSGLSTLWASGATRLNNAGRWNAFWRDGREQKLRELLVQEGKKFGFSEKAFASFFNGLYYDEGLAGLDSINMSIFDKYVFSHKGGYRSVVYFNDTFDNIDAVSIAAGKEAYIISSRRLEKLSTEASSRDMGRMALIAGLFVALLTAVFLRKPFMTIAALVPVVTGVTWMLGVMSLLGQTINAANLMATIIVIGLSVDYGIFMAYRCRYNLQTGTVTAVTLSVLSTLIGAGALLFAKHPALFSVGMTLAIGISAGALAAVLVVPAMYATFGGRHDG